MKLNGRCLLGLPAWFWLVLPGILLLVIKLVGPPGPLPERSDIDRMFDNGLLFTRDGTSFRFVTFDQRANVKPLWYVAKTVTTHSTVVWQFGVKTGLFHLWASNEMSQFKWSGVPRGTVQTRPEPEPTEAVSGIHFGFYKRTMQWRWSLDTLPFTGPVTQQSNGDAGLSASELQTLKPLVITELNRRSGEKRWGDALEKALRDGREKTSYVCLQNALILAEWISCPLALVAVGFLLFRRQKTAS